MPTIEVVRFFPDRRGAVLSTLTITCGSLEVAMHVLATVRGRARLAADGSLAGLIVNGRAVPVTDNQVHTNSLARALAIGGNA